MKNQVFFACTVLVPVLFKSRDQMGSRRAKLLWMEIMELLGGDFVRMIKDQLYGKESAEDDDIGAYS
jgi:hypothetical protein